MKPSETSSEKKYVINKCYIKSSIRFGRRDLFQSVNRSLNTYVFQLLPRWHDNIQIAFSIRHLGR
jgi:hypothetical protein